MKKTALLIALLGVTMTQAGKIKQNIRKNLAEVGEGEAADRTLDIDWNQFSEVLANCDIAELPPVNCNPGIPPIPNCPPPPQIHPCPTFPSTNLPGTGILTASGTQTAAERSVEHICLHDTACMEGVTGSEDRSGTNYEKATSCLVHKKKYVLCGCIDYEKHQTQHELGEIRSASAAESCTVINAAAGFVGGNLGEECPVELECPCLDLETHPDLCPPDREAPTVSC